MTEDEVIAEIVRMRTEDGGAIAGDHALELLERIARAAKDEGDKMVLAILSEELGA